MHHYFQYVLIVICIIECMLASTFKNIESLDPQSNEQFHFIIEKTSKNANNISTLPNISMLSNKQNHVYANAHSSSQSMLEFDFCTQNHKYIQRSIQSSASKKIRHIEDSYTNSHYYNRDRTFQFYTRDNMLNQIQTQKTFPDILDTKNLDTNHNTSFTPYYLNILDNSSNPLVKKINADRKISQFRENQFFEQKYNSTSNYINHNLYHTILQTSRYSYVPEQFFKSNAMPCNLPNQLQNSSRSKYNYQNLYTSKNNHASQPFDLSKNVEIEPKSIQTKPFNNYFFQNTSLTCFTPTSIQPLINNQKRKIDQIQFPIDQYKPKKITKTQQTLQNSESGNQLDTSDDNSHPKSEIVIFRRLLSHIIIENSNFNNLYKSFQNYYADFSVFKSKKFYEIMDSSLNNAMMNLESMTSNNNIKMNLSNFKHSKFTVFCIFCFNNSCLSSSNGFISSFDYRSKLNQVITGHSSLSIRNDIISLINDIEKYYFKMHTLNLFDFAQYLMRQQKKLMKIFEHMQEFRIFTINNIKQEIIVDLMHNFQCNHLEIKLSLLPEFFSLFFLSKKQNCDTSLRKNNSLFFSFFFYLRSINLFFDFFHQSQFLKKWKQENNEIVYETKINTLSLLLRSNFIVPLILLLTGNEKILLQYRFIFCSIFKLEIQKMNTQNFGKNFEYDLLKTMIWVACCDIVGFHSNEQFSYYISSKSMNYFIMRHSEIFRKFTFLLQKLKFYRPKLIFNEQIKDFKYLENILKYCTMLQLICSPDSNKNLM